LVELWLATGESHFWDELETPEIDETFFASITRLWWQNLIYMAVDVALETRVFPDGWSSAATTAIIERADGWRGAHETHAYRRVWYAADHGYFHLAGWGSNLYFPLRALVAAWRLSEDETYREAALLGLDYHMGANPQGRVHTTGLGDHRTTVALHLPSWADDIAEVTPGITLYGPSVGVPWTASSYVYGLSVDGRSDPFFEEVDVAMMPPPWDNESMSIDDVSDALYEVIPGWRRFVPLEQSNVALMEFTVWETIAPAAGVTGCLMGEGWVPDAALIEREPLSESAQQSSLWVMP
jgi:hypothetical protein